MMANLQGRVPACISFDSLFECKPQLVIQKPTHLSLNMSNPVCAYPYIWNLAGISPIKLQLAQEGHSSSDIDSFTGLFPLR